MSATTSEDNIFTVHTSRLFSVPDKIFMPDMSLQIDRQTGEIVGTFVREEGEPFDPKPGDVDLRHLYVIPGLVGSYTRTPMDGYQ